jgi:hypothetical protein
MSMNECLGIAFIAIAIGLAGLCCSLPVMIYALLKYDEKKWMNKEKNQ